MFKPLFVKEIEGEGFCDFKCSEDNKVLINSTLLKKSHIHLLDENFNKIDEIVIDPAKTIKVVLFDGAYLAFSENHESFSLFDTSNKFKLIEKKAFDLLLKSNGSYVVASYKDEPAFTGLLNDNEVKWKQSNIYLPFFCKQSNKMLAFNSVDSNWVIDRSKFTCFDLKTGNPLWSQSIAEQGRYYEGKLKYDRKTFHGEVEAFLGVFNGILWAVLNNGLLIGLDIETGKVLHKIGAPEQYPTEATRFEEQRSMNYFFHRNSLLDKDHGKIIGLFRAGYSDNCFNWYFETDLNVAEPRLSITKVESPTDIPFEIDGNPCPVWPFDNDFIYVCNYREYKIALFNRKTKKIDWVHQLEVEAAKRTFIIQMQVQGNRWYILDNTKNLYVYER